MSIDYHEDLGFKPFDALPVACAERGNVDISKSLGPIGMARFLQQFETVSLLFRTRLGENFIILRD